MKPSFVAIFLSPGDCESLVEKRTAQPRGRASTVPHLANRHQIIHPPGEFDRPRAPVAGQTGAARQSLRHTEEKPLETDTSALLGPATPDREPSLPNLDVRNGVDVERPHE